MRYLVLEIRTITATFRNPEFQNFHKSLFLPPPTTLIGLAGSAMGLSPRAAQDWFENGAWHFGIAGTSGGYTKDLWKYRTLDSDPVKQSSILLREILFDNNFLIVFACSDAGKLTELENAFWRPKYALTLGSSDSLAKLVSSQVVLENSKSCDLENCLLPGNVLDNVINNLSSGVDFSIYTSSEPIAFDLPVRFHYESDYGTRRVIRRQTFSFIGSPMRLNFEIDGILAKNQFIPVFALNTEYKHI